MLKGFFRKNLFVVFAVFLFGAMAGAFLLSAAFDVRFCSKNNFTFVNSELGCHGHRTIQKHEYEELRLKIIEYVEAEKSAGRLNRFALYFRDLERGPTFGINQQETFIPASLLKVPILLAYFKIAEDDPSLLEQELSFAGNLELERTIQTPPKKTIKENTPYRVSDLLFTMTAFSDNRSYEVLFKNLYNISPSVNLVHEVYRELGLVIPSKEFLESLSVKSYASIFRILYNISYLSPEYSEKALSILAQSDFGEGIDAGIPDTIVSANKFGEAVANDGTQELHDCGIIYHPQNHYILCVMTVGSDRDELSGLIAAISRMVYEEVDSRRIK